MINKKETTLLDSSLNTVPLFANLTFNSYKKYNIKLINCKGFKQLYVFSKSKLYKYKNIENELYKTDYDKKTIFNDKIDKNKNYTNNDVLYKNVMRSKVKLQRLAKCNGDVWKTFITLTFNTNITNLTIAYNKFRNLTRSISRIKKDFKWLCVPEFQKSGRVHYHLVTNIDLNEPKIVLKQYKNNKIYYHLKHWQKNGFDCIESVKDKDGNDTKKLCGYISKYMTKSYIENVFYNKNRYYCSQNLNQPIETIYDLEKEEDVLKLNNLLGTSNLIYQNIYSDKFNNSILFFEYIDM